MKLTVGKFTVDEIDAFGSFVIALTIFGAEGLAAKCNIVGFQDLVGRDERESVR